MPSGFGVLKAMTADPYNGPWGGKNCRDSPIQTKRECSCKAGECQATDKWVVLMKPSKEENLMLTKV